MGTDVTLRSGRWWNVGHSHKSQCCVALLTYWVLYLSGLIHVGDELREVNGIPVEDKRPEEIIQILVSCYLFCKSQVSQPDLESALQIHSADLMLRNASVFSVNMLLYQVNVGRSNDLLTCREVE